MAKLSSISLNSVLGRLSGVLSGLNLDHFEEIMRDRDRKRENELTSMCLPKHSVYAAHSVEIQDFFCHSDFTKNEIVPKLDCYLVIFKGM